jgi:hypothetical protein
MSTINPYDAVSDNVDRLLHAWREQIERDYERILEEGKRLREEDEAQRTRLERLGRQESLDAAIDHSVADYIEALVSRAQHIDVGALQIPTSVRSVASAAAHEISALRGQVFNLDASNLDDPAIQAQQAAMSKLEHGLLPHPSDLSIVMNANKLDPIYAERFAEIGKDLERLDRKSSKLPQLQAHNGFARLELLHEYGEMLGSYSTGRLVGLVTKPSKVTGLAAAPSPTAMRTRGMNDHDFNSMMNQFTRRS